MEGAAFVRRRRGLRLSFSTIHSEESRLTTVVPNIEIVTILGRTEEGNGVSRPFRCEDEQGRLYYVKLKNVGYNELVKEWVAGRLCQVLGINVAVPHQVSISPALVSGIPEYERELGHGIGFGSLEVEFNERLALDPGRGDSDGSLSKILLFDRWVKNSDRTLSELGGNPNLLWDVAGKKVVVIDNDNAFDPNFDEAAFWQGHALRAFQSAWNPELRKESSAWLTEGLRFLPSIWKELPESWLRDDYGDPRADLTLPFITDILSRALDHPNDRFWTLPDR